MALSTDIEQNTHNSSETQSTLDSDNESEAHHDMSSHLDANSELLSTANDSYYNLLVSYMAWGLSSDSIIIYVLSVGPDLPTTSGGESAPASDISAECDIGKLLELKINISTLSREDKYRILTSEPDSDASTYP